MADHSMCILWNARSDAFDDYFIWKKEADFFPSSRVHYYEKNRSSPNTLELDFNSGYDYQFVTKPGHSIRLHSHDYHRNLHVFETYMGDFSCNPAEKKSIGFGFGCLSYWLCRGSSLFNNITTVYAGFVWINKRKANAANECLDRCRCLPACMGIGIFYDYKRKKEKSRIWQDRNS